jgi:hypothetical protein
MQDHRFIFVCGLHRSGTSILFKSLRDHPEVSGFHNTDSPEDEGMHLQSIYKPSGYYGGAGKFGFHPEAHLIESSPLVTGENRPKLFSEWSPYWDLSKQYLLEKSPPNLIRTRFLQAMFPDSYFIIMLRHPLAVSYATRKWYKKYRIYWRSFPRIFEHWLVCHEIFLQDRPYLKNAMILNYEQFVADPSAYTNQIYEFLGMSPHPNNQKVLSGVNKKYFSMWKKDLNGFLSGIVAKRMIKRFETRLNRFGYSLTDLERADSIAE